MNQISKNREVVFLCVGNSKIWFDSFGPMIGSLLMYLNIDKFIYGNLKKNIKGDNIEEYIDMIYRFHHNPYIVVFDSAISNREEVYLKIREGSTRCASFSSSPVDVGDLSVLLCFSKNNIKNLSNYKLLLKNVKKVAGFIKLIVCGKD